MSYIVPDELPKSCSKCPFCYLIMQNPLSSKTPIKRYRCQVGKAPWRTFDVDFYDEEYKDEECPLVPMQDIAEMLEWEMRNAMKNYKDDSESYDLGVYQAFKDAAKIVKEVGGMNG